MSCRLFYCRGLTRWTIPTSIPSIYNKSTSQHWGLPRRIVGAATHTASHATDTSVVPNQRIRNIGISAHIDHGKTTLTERILYYAGRIEQIHEVRGRDGVGATMDSMELERQRGITIRSAATYIDWNGYQVNIIDTPGHVDFTIEVERALRVLDGAVLVLCGVGGVQSQTLTVNRQLTRYEVPCIAFINKLDRMWGDADRVLQQLRTRLNHNAAMVTLPVGREAEFIGVVDLIKQRMVQFEGRHGERLVYSAVPEALRDRTRAARRELIERVADVDEEIGDLFLADSEPTESQLYAAIRRAVIRRTFTPVFVGSALKNKGVQTLLDGVVNFLPDPSERDHSVMSVRDGVADSDSRTPLDPSRDAYNPFVALAFKLDASSHGQLSYIRVYQGALRRGESVTNSRTRSRTRIQRLVRLHADQLTDTEWARAGDIVAIHGVDCAASGDTLTRGGSEEVTMEGMFVPEPVVSLSVTPNNRAASEKFSRGLARFQREDPTLRVAYDREYKETVMSGMGELHLEVYAQRLEREFGCAVTLGQPRVAFRETLTERVAFDFLHKKQSGGRGQYGRVKGYVEPMENSTYNEFLDSTSGLNIPKNFIPHIRSGFLSGCESGPLIGHKLSGIRMVLQDGASHPVDSNDIAFTLAGLGALRQVIDLAMDATAVSVVEPVMRVEVSAPTEFQDAAVHLISLRSGSIDSVYPAQELFSIEATVPLNDMFGFSASLRSCTQGKGEFTMEYSHYSPCRTSVLETLLDKFRSPRGRK